MKILSIGLFGAALLMSGTVAAKDYHHPKQPANADQYYGDYPALAPSKVYGADFEQPGARGREGLGESPFHPEGLGNVTD